jgi:hypothetical protein
MSATAAVLGRATARLAGVVLDLRGEQHGQERREVDGKAGIPFRAAVRIVLGREPVEPALEFAQLPFDVDLLRLGVLVF